ncbi:MAG: hypothetical protein AAF718_17515 [Pseudomonadota bacterium]
MWRLLPRPTDIYCIVLSALGGAIAPALVNACAFHGYTPEPTLVDRLLATEQVAIVNIEPETPGQYVRVETLLGPSVSGMPFPKDIALQGQGRATATYGVLLLRDGSYGPWLEAAILDQRFNLLVARILERRQVWQLGHEADRLAFFAHRVNDRNPEIRKLALRELDRAPYGALRQVSLPSIRHLKQALQNDAGELAPIYALLAGLSGDRSFSPLLTAKLASAVQNRTTYLGAYATALIELEGSRAVSEILREYVYEPTLEEDIREKLLGALAIQHRVADALTRRAIARGMAELIRRVPDAQDGVARYFGVRASWALTGASLNRP